jgi:hypothetical protein
MRQYVDTSAKYKATEQKHNNATTDQCLLPARFYRSPRRSDMSELRDKPTLRDIVD